jgi:hypothetical protein
MNVVERIGIFRGKERTYNELVLRTLFLEGHLKGWELAKKIYERMKETKRLPKKWIHLNWYPVTQKIYSVLVRKPGRLSDLLKKGYLEKFKEDKGYLWSLTLKGVIASLILDKGLADQESEYLEHFRNELQSLPEKFTSLDDSEVPFFPKGIGTRLGEYVRTLSKSAFPGVLPGIIPMVENVIENGIDLDTIKTDNLLYLVFLQVIRNEESK